MTLFLSSPVTSRGRSRLTSRRRSFASLVAVPLLGLALAGCGSQADAPEPTTTAVAPQATAALTVTDAWAKAADTGMTAVFGTLTNGGDAAVHIVSASTPVAARTEIHEVVMGSNGQMVMQPKQDGLTIPAGGSHTLAPGQDHLMLLELTGPVKPGDDVAVTLTLGDGQTVDFTATARTFDGGNESYHGGGTPSMGGSETGMPAMTGTP